MHFAQETGGFRKFSSICCARCSVLSGNQFVMTGHAHMRLHLLLPLAAPFFLSFSSMGCKLRVRLVSSLSSSSKSSLTLVPSLADVSTYLHFHICCKRERETLCKPRCDLIFCIPDGPGRLYYFAFAV